MRTLKQQVEDWFLNSPGWPFPVDVQQETADFLRDGSKYGREEIRAEITRFAQEQQAREEIVKS